MPTTTILAISALVPLCLWLVLSCFRRGSLPPGPPGLPLIGNILGNPGASKYLTYKAWGDKYGPITYFRLFNEDVVLLNTREAALKSLEKRSGIYADRPRQIIMSWNRGIALCRAGPRHRAYRKLVGGTLSASASKLLWDVQEKAAHSFARQLWEEYATSPEKKNEPDYRFLDILRRSIGLNVVGIISGSEPASADGNSEGMTEEEMINYIGQADHAHALFLKALAPFAYMVDFIPLLKHVPEFVPFAAFKRDARIAREGLESLTMFPYQKTRNIDLTVSFVKKSGSSQKSYVDSLFEANPNPTKEEEEAFAWTAMSTYTGGSDTTIASVTSIFFVAALHPEAQALAQIELDSIVGQGRMPVLKDRESLPYVNAFVQECLRCVPVAPLGVAHRALESDTIEGYYIPKGATVIGNIWAMLHDENIYNSPSMFDPSRFLPPTGTPTNPEIVGRSEPDIGSLPFGFGRRICPGMHLADTGIWIYAASILWAFNIQVKADNLNNVDLAARWIDAQFSDGAIMCPLPFEVDLSARSPDIESLLRKDLN